MGFSRTGWIVLAAAATVVGTVHSSELIPPNVLVWDGEYKQHNAGPGETNAAFTFWVTNVCSTNVLILNVETSCGCAVTKTPKLPWVLWPGESGPIKVDLDLRGRQGALFKGVHLTTSAGVKSLVVRVNLPAPTAVTNSLPTHTMRRLPPAAPLERKPPPPPRKW
jgi:hypothetical protein